MPAIGARCQAQGRRQIHCCTMLIVFVEGTIGVGKSSALNALERGGQAVVFEQVAEWSLWADRLAAPRSHTFSFQVQVCMSMFARIRDAIRLHQGDRSVLYCERSVLSSTVFAMAAHARGHMLDAELELLADLATHLQATLCAGHQFMSVLLQCPVSVAVDRIRARGRPGEETLGAAPVADLQARFAAFCATASVVNTGAGGPDEVAKAIILKTQLSRLRQSHSF